MWWNYRHSKMCNNLEIYFKLTLFSFFFSFIHRKTHVQYLRFHFPFQHSLWPVNVNEAFMINLKQTAVWQRRTGENLSAAVTSLPLHAKCFISEVTVCSESVSLSLFGPQLAWWGWWGGVRGKGAVNNIRLPPSLSRQRWRQVWVGIATIARPINAGRA